MTNKVTYPKIERDCWKSVKITTKEHPKIKLLSKLGMSSQQIASMYNVTKTPILYIINPDYKKRQYAARMNFIRRYRKDAKYRKYESDWNNQHIKQRYRECPEFREYIHNRNVVAWQNHVTNKEKSST